MKRVKVVRRRLRYLTGITLAASAMGPFVVHAAGIPTLDVVEVEADAEELAGTADTASVGTVTREQILARPTYRPGELLEEVPGLIVTQHSGEGKANQFFLRGFNLDHGTDFSTSFAGIPINQRSHGHGQGYNDLNFIIPELVNVIQYKKGPYFAEEGDFSAAGAVNLDYVNVLPQGIASLGVGEDDFQRLFIADSSELGVGNLLYGLELTHLDGPWENPNDFEKVNAVLRYSQGTAQDGFNVTLLGYDSDGEATNQIAERAVDSGEIGLFGTFDDSDFVDAQRYSLSAGWRRTWESSLTEADIYVEHSDLELFSNFSYFLNDPVNGDQFEQTDRRVKSGFNVAHTWFANWGGYEVENAVGLQFRNDNISNGLFNTVDRVRLSTVREDDIVESSAGVYFENRTQWTDKFRTVAGLRYDYYDVDVDSDRVANSGSETDGIFSPKLGLIFGPWANTEYYVNAGRSFHSNDARGATITVDPVTGLTVDADGNPIEPVDLLVEAEGYEVGLRTALIPGLQTTFTIFQLDLDSELLFIGDAGTTEANRPSRRVGFEFTNYYKATEWLTLDLDIAYTDAEFTDSGPDHIPGAIEGVATVGAAVDNLGPWFGGVQLRYFGPRPLDEAGDVESDSTTLFSGRVGYKINKDLSVALEGFNLLDVEDSQISYLYESRTPAELAAGQAGQEGVHIHPVEERSFRLFVQLNFD